MVTLLSCHDDIVAVAIEIKIPPTNFPQWSKEQQNSLAEFTTVLGEERRLVCQLQADREVPRILRELHERLRFMAADMARNDVSFYSNESISDCGDSTDIRKQIMCSLTTDSICPREIKLV